MKLTETQRFKISKEQKKTLKLLNEKYCINASLFIREAINEKLEREKDDIFKQHKEIQDYLKNSCPF